jgi:hypothetical protein
LGKHLPVEQRGPHLACEAGIFCLDFVQLGFGRLRELELTIGIGDYRRSVVLRAVRAVVLLCRITSLCRLMVSLRASVSGVYAGIYGFLYRGV